MLKNRVFGQKFFACGANSRGVIQNGSIQKSNLNEKLRIYSVHYPYLSTEFFITNAPRIPSVLLSWKINPYPVRTRTEDFQFHPYSVRYQNPYFGTGTGRVRIPYPYSEIEVSPYQYRFRTLVFDFNPYRFRLRTMFWNLTRTRTVSVLTFWEVTRTHTLPVPVLRTNFRTC